MLTQKEALNLTRELRNNVKENSRLMREAWDTKVWLTLGYKTINEWLTEAVGISRARGYQLLAIANMEDRFREALPVSDSFVLTFQATRAVSDYGVNNFINTVKKDTTDKTADEVVYGLISAIRAGEVTTPTQPVPEPVSNPEHIVIAAEHLSRQAENYPTPEELTDLNELRVVRGKLRDTITRLENTINAIKENN